MIHVMASIVVRPKATPCVGAGSAVGTPVLASPPAVHGFAKIA